MNFCCRQSIEVNLAYRLWRFDWSVEKNCAVYGAFARPEGVGGRWRIVLELVTDWNDQDPEWGATMTWIRQRLNDKRVWEIWPELRDQASTCERVALRLAKDLEGVAAPLGKWSSITIHENRGYSCRVEFAQIGYVTRVFFKAYNLTLGFSGEADSDSGRVVIPSHVTQVAKDLFDQEHPMWASPHAIDESAFTQRLYSVFAEKLSGLSYFEIEMRPNHFVRMSS